MFRRRYGAGKTLPIRILRVIDGDSLEVKRRGLFQCFDRPFQVRLFGIDAPELSQPLGHEAKAQLERLCRGRLRLIVRSTDPYQRVVGIVERRRGRPSLNEEMVESGFAYHHVRFAPNAEDLAGAEAKARADRRGIWGLEEPPQLPWEYRRQFRPQVARRTWAPVRMGLIAVRGLIWLLTLPVRLTWRLLPRRITVAALLAGVLLVLWLAYRGGLLQLWLG